MSINSFPPHIRNHRESQLGLTRNSDNPISRSEALSSDVLQSLRTCAAKKNLKLGSCVHAKILKSGFDANVVVSNSLLDLYRKCESFEDAAKVFDHMPQRTVESWTSMMSGYCKKECWDEVMCLFKQMLESLPPNEYTLAVLLQACAKKGDPKLVKAVHCFAIRCGFDKDYFLQNSMIDAYGKSRALGTAENVLEGFGGRDVVSWTSAISAHVGNGTVERALELFVSMQEDGVFPNEVTTLSILKACSLIGQGHIFQWIHGLVMKTEWCRNVHVLNSLVDMYATDGKFIDAMRLFCLYCFTGEEMYLRPETMVTLLQGCGHSSRFMLGKEIHGYLTKHGFLSCTVVGNSLMDMYRENREPDTAFQVFKTTRFKDIITWNTLMACLVNSDQHNEALKLLSEIHGQGVEDEILPDFVTILTSIQACSKLPSLPLGEVVHGYAIRAGLVCDTFVQNSLIDMYGKSGRLDLAEQIFEEMSIRDLGSWNSLIGANGMNGNGTSALHVFNELKKSGIHRPNAITFTNALSACAHSGLVVEGFEIFNSMRGEHGINPGMEHFACMVDLLGRSGRLEEAEDFVDKMPVKPGPDVWAALLGACALSNNDEMAERTASKLNATTPNSRVWKVALSNIYASVGRWEDAVKARADMREQRKEGGWSSVEVKGQMHRFAAADTSHPDSDMVYNILNGSVS